MLDSFLSDAEDERDRDDLDYSPVVGLYLKAIYKRPLARRFHGVHTQLEPLLPSSMGTRQRVRLCYALGMSYMDARRADLAAEHFDHALATTQLNQDASAFAVLAFQQAHLHYSYYSIISAQDFAQDAFEAYCTLPHGESYGDPAQNSVDFGLTLIWELATQAFLLEEYQAALGYLKGARELSGQLASRRHREASIAWTAALVQRWQRRPIAALGFAREAVALYDEYNFGTSQERARMSVVFAEIAMDAAESMDADQDDLNGSVAVHLFEEATQRLLPALTDLSRDGDILGLARAQLVHARHSRVGTYPVDRWELYQAIEELGVAVDDRPLLCQVWTERGNDFQSGARPTPALMCYQRALDALGSCDASAMGMWARRALLDHGS